MDGGNNKEIKEEQKEIFIRISKIGTEIKYETNVPDLVIGFGLCEFAKLAVNEHIMKLKLANQPKVKLPFGRR